LILDQSTDILIPQLENDALLKIVEINSFASFSQLRKIWSDILISSENDNIFLTWEYLANSIVNNFKNRDILRIICVVDDEIIAIAPLKQSRYAFGRWFGYDVIEPLGYQYSDYTGFIFQEQFSECLRLILEYLLRQNSWDFIYLYDLPETSIVPSLLRETSMSFPQFSISEGKVCPYVTIPNSMNEIIKNLSPKFRKNLRRSMKRLRQDHGRIELKKYNEIGSYKEAMKNFLDLHQNRWKSKGRKGAFPTQNARDRVLEATRLYDENGWLQLHFLTVEGEPVAAQYCLQYNQKLYYWLGGFNPDYSMYSVGNLLTLKMLEYCVQNKIKEYDFLKGDEAYKRDWSSQYRRNLNIKFVNDKFSSKCIKFGINVSKRTGLQKALGRFRQP
jgi:CelD/BcsL family acetyltransferase involved in cellulose biosynthesis